MSSLDAAHITPDSDAEGEPIVSNGVALCKLHHAAFDRFFFAIRPDYVIEVRPSVLRESSGDYPIRISRAILASSAFGVVRHAG